MTDAEVDVIRYGDYTLGRNCPIISLDLHRKLIVPRLKKITKEQKKGAYLINHTDGNTYPILEDLVSTGVDGMHPFEPQAGMDLKVL